jgi:hypothetical protein
MRSILSLSVILPMVVPASVFADAAQDRAFVQRQADQWTQRLQVCSSSQIALDAESRARLREDADSLVRRYRVVLMSHRQLQAQVNEMIDLNSSALQIAIAKRALYITSGVSAAAAAVAGAAALVGGGSGGTAAGGGAALETRAALEVAERVGLGYVAAPAASGGGEILGLLTLGGIGAGVGAMTEPGQEILSTTRQGVAETADYVAGAFRDSFSSQGGASYDRTIGAATRAQADARAVTTDALSSSDVLSADLSSLSPGGLNHLSRDLMTQLGQFDRQMNAARAAVSRKNSETMRTLQRKRDERTWVGGILHSNSDDSEEISETMAYIMSQEDLAFREMQTIGRVLNRMEAVCGSLARPTASSVADGRTANRRVAFVRPEAVSDESGLKSAAPAAETAVPSSGANASGAN